MPETEDIKGMVYSRFEAMRTARANIDQKWEIYQQMIDAIYTPYPDERSSSTVPLASSLIELYVAEAIKIATEYNFKPTTSKYAAAAKALEHVWKFDWRKNNRKLVFTRDEYIAAGFGTSIIYTGYEAYDKVQSDPVPDGDGIKWKKKTIKKSEIVVKNIDIRNFFIDNQAIEGIEDAQDCILIQWMGFEVFQNFKSNPMFHNIDQVKPRNYSNENKVFTTQEDQSKTGNFVKLMHYWNVQKDKYVVIANDVEVRNHPLVSTIDGEKALPFVVRGFGYKNYSIYYRGLCESLMMFNSEINNLREMLMDGIRRSNNPILAIGNGLSFNGRTISFQNEVLTFDGDLSNNFQQITGVPPNQAIFSYLERIYKDIAIFCGIDVQNLIGEANQTAFQTEVQREASQKRINVRLTNRDLARERFANLYKDLLQTRYPIKDAEGIYPEIEIEGEELVGEGEKKRFRPKKGYHTFSVTPELLRGDVYVDVYTNTNIPTINAVNIEQRMKFASEAGNIAAQYSIAKQSGYDLEKFMPFDATMRELASDSNIPLEQKGGEHEDVEAGKKAFEQQLMSMMPQPPLDPNQTNEPQLPTSIGGGMAPPQIA